MLWFQQWKIGEPRFNWFLNYKEANVKDWKAKARQESAKTIKEYIDKL